MDEIHKGYAIEEYSALGVLFQGLEPFGEFLSFVVTLIGNVKEGAQTNPGLQIGCVFGDCVLEHVGGRLDQLFLILLTFGDLIHV